MKTKALNPKMIAILTSLFVMVVGFQNCSEAEFSSSNKTKTDGGNNGSGNPDDPDDGDDDDDTVGGCDECPTGEPRKNVDTANVAFEDLFPNSPNDYDYNDFVASYKIKENYDRWGLNQIDIRFTPRTKIAGYTHSFLFNLVGKRSTKADSADAIQTLPAFTDDCAIAVLKYFDKDGNLLSTAEVDPYKDITIFTNTDALLDSNGQALITAHLTVWMGQKGSTATRQTVEFARYRPLLRVTNNAELLEVGEINPHHISAEGYPHAVIVPEDSFSAPGELQHVESKYPKFANFRAYLLHKKADPSYVGTDDEVLWYINSMSALAAL